RGPPPPAGSKRQEDNQRSTTEDDIELPDKRRTDPAAHLVLQPAMVPAVVRQQHVLQISQTVLVLNRDMIRPTHGTPRIQLPIPVRHPYLHTSLQALSCTSVHPQCSVDRLGELAKGPSGEF